jgi:hypothetical protein
MARYGNCDGCKWWSQLCAESIGCGPIDALCLNADSKNHSKMVHDGCKLKVLGKSVDDPTYSYSSRS